MEITNTDNTDILSNKSQIFELPLKVQSETQSYKLDQSESKPNTTLKKIGQELDVAETKCFTLKSELNYMLGVCRKAQIEIKRNKGTSDILHERIMSSSKNLTSMPPVEYCNYNREITAADKIRNYEILKNIHNIGREIEDDFDRSVRDGDIIENSENMRSKEARQKKSLNVATASNTQLGNRFFPTPTTTIPIQNKIMQENRERESMLHYYPENIPVRTMRDGKGFEESIEKKMSKTNVENYSRAIPADVLVKPDIRNVELNLDKPEDTKAKRETERSKCVSELQRDDVNFTCETNDAVRKVRKKKGKLRKSASKSTVTTKDTNPIGKKEEKRRRYKGQGVTHQRSTSFSNRPKKSIVDIVEIFHNTTLENSNSGIFSKRSHLGRKAKYLKKQRLDATANQTASHERSRRNSESIDRECQSCDGEDQSNYCFRTLNCQSNPGVIPENVEEQNELSCTRPDDAAIVRRCEVPEFEHASDKFNDSTLTRNYEMPTLASKLKRTNRLYLGGFNFRNIPFVVGTSVTPSYNLGLNIQQVLSVMKMRQPIANDAIPLLIHEVSKGAKQPLSIRRERINGRCEKLLLDSNSRANTETLGNADNSLHTICRNKRLSVLDLLDARKARSVHASPNSTNAKMIFGQDSIPKQLYDERKDEDENREITQRLTAARNERPGIPKIISLNEEDNSSDRGTRTRAIVSSNNSKGIRDVLMNLHDQFEEMNAKYEKLQSQVGKSSDKSLNASALSTLEKELNIKEEEINVLVGLYKEVMMLKQQMKMLHERNSLICIATDSFAKSYENPLSASIISGKSRLTNAARFLSRGKGDVCGTAREPPASMQLAALLRQIQTFHKQLQLVS